MAGSKQARLEHALHSQLKVGKDCGYSKWTVVKVRLLKHFHVLSVPSHCIAATHYLCSDSQYVGGVESSNMDGNSRGAGLKHDNVAHELALSVERD